MIAYRENKVISMEDFEKCIVETGFTDKRVIWDTFAEGYENDTYIWICKDVLDNMIDNLEYDLETWAKDEKTILGIVNQIHLVVLVERLMSTEEIPDEFLLNIYW